MKDFSKGTSLVMMSLVAVAIGGTYFLTDSIQEPALSTQEESGFARGHLEVVVYDEHGDIKAYRQSDNHIVGDGVEILIAELFASLAGGVTSTGPVSHLEIGTGGETGPADDDTDVETAITDCARVSTTNTGDAAADVSGSLATIDVVVTATIDASSDTDCATTSIDEAGLFNDATAGEMFARNTFTAVDLTTSDSLALTWTFTFSDA